MALSYVQYVGDGTTETFAVPFPYLSRSHVNVTVDLEPVSFSWDDPYTVRVSPAPGAGSVVEVRRNTERDRRLVDFVDGSVLTETDLDVSSLQVFFIVQEAIDIAGGTLELKSDGSYGAHGRRISDVGTPVNARDAVTKEYHDGTFIPQMQGLLSQTTAARDTTITARDTTIAARDAAIAARDLAQQYRDAANSHRQAAATSEANALAHKNAAATSETNAANSASQAASSKSAAETAKTAAETARDQAQTYRNEALNFRNQAEGFKNDAAASAAAAALFDPSTYYNKTQSDGRFVRKDTTTSQHIPGPLSVSQSLGVRALPGQNVGIALTDENGNEVALIYATPSTGFLGIRRKKEDGSYAQLKFLPDTITYNDKRLITEAEIDPWAMQPIGVPIPVFDHIPGASVPPRNKGYRYVVLRAGDTGSGRYNEGILTNETVSGSAPLINATAVINLPASPMHGQTIRLICTEQRFIRAGWSGTVQDDAFQGHWHTLVATTNGGVGATTDNTGGTGITRDNRVTTPVTDGWNGTPRVANETRPRNIQATYFMRIL